jgi:hypothetical protein
MTISPRRYLAVSNLTSNDNNIYIGSRGEANESNTICIDDGSLVATFIAGMFRIKAKAVTTLISIDGQLGITSRRNA